jgi:lipopolysaccharide transport system ATP-binding protein
MSSDEIAIRVEGVSKRYLMFEKPEDRLKQMLMPRLARIAGRPPRCYYRNFAAVNEVSFTVSRGETVGIVGRNGSGKSTMLQMICGTLQPSSGQIRVKGRIAALLELGAGFNPEFTGRENVYLNAAILGLSRAETARRFDDIANFADIGTFIDQPVRTYSSGMYVRLAFAVAINVDPDILVVDEALAVGDEAFQRKCYARIEDIRDKGGTILFVSHAAQTILQLCNRAMLFDTGEMILEGRPKTVVNQYQRLANLSGEAALAVREEIKLGGAGTPPLPVVATDHDASDQPLSIPRAAGSDEAWFDPTLISASRVEYESQGAKIDRVRITTPDGRVVNVLQSGRRYVYEYSVSFDREVRNVGFGMLIKTIDGLALGGAATDFTERLRLQIARPGTRYRARFELTWALNAGTYFLNAGVTGETNGAHNYSHRLLDALAFRILPQPEQVATGFINFDPDPAFERVDAGVCEDDVSAVAR